jgi:selenide,water dikinase
VGFDTGDDAAVWRLDDDAALVVTADFITPVVDDPAAWGRIAAANSVSDVYAMGGTPLLALNLLAWDPEQLGLDLLADVVRGGAEVATAGGWLTVGGHMVHDPEPKFGLAVVGTVDPSRVLTNTGLRPGDALVLTKALGTGIISTAIKAGTAPEATVAAAAASMTQLNDQAARQALAAGAAGATDITGFGLLGHLGRMAEASGVDVTVWAPAVPVLPGVADLAAAGFVPGGTRRNLAWVNDRLDVSGVDDLVLAVLADAQTSGGLLFGARPEEAERAVAALRQDGHAAALIGDVRDGTGSIRVEASSGEGPA